MNAAHYRRLKAAFDARAELPEPPHPVVDLLFDVDRGGGRARARVPHAAMARQEEAGGGRGRRGGPA